MKIKDLLICPECKIQISDNMACNSCGTLYEYQYGVYDVISQNLSANQKTYWQVTEEEIEKADDFESKIPADYELKLSDETKLAQKKVSDYMDKLIETFSGTVCDLATGMGRNLQQILRSQNQNFNIVCTDIDKNILALTKKIKDINEERIAYVATDGRHMSFSENTFDYATSLSGFGNIPESDKVASELYRILKPGGKLIISGGFVDKNSQSYDIAKEYKLEIGFIEEYLIQELTNAGFKNINSTIVDKAIWAENPYDLLPVAGDMLYFYVLVAVK